jgi:hypothetical protein
MCIYLERDNVLLNDLANAMIMYIGGRSMTVSTEHWRNNIDREKPKVREKNLSHCYFVICC